MLNPFFMLQSPTSSVRVNECKTRGLTHHSPASVLLNPRVRSRQIEPFSNLFIFPPAHYSRLSIHRKKKQ